MHTQCKTKIIRGYSFQTDSAVVCTIGNFDGYHIGHQALIRKLRALAQKYNCASVVMTFEPHPAHVLGRWKPRIQTPEQKLRSLIHSHVDYVWIVPFTQAFGSISPHAFLQEFLFKYLKARALVVGYDFRFGSHQLGDNALLQSYCSRHSIELHIVDKVSYGSIDVHSSLLRKHILEGRVEELYQYLNRFYTVSGTVVRGQGIGKKHFVPTANIFWHNDLIPCNGVYITQTRIGHVIKNSITNIGVRPTFAHHILTFETHIFDHTEDIVGEEIEVMFLKRLRDEKAFDTIEELRKQIYIDIEKAKKYFLAHD